MTAMFRKRILKDAVGAGTLLAACLIGGVVINEIRPNPLPLVYSSPEVRLHQTVKKLDGASGLSIPLDGDVDLDEMHKISATRAALILDARPEIFYRLGHIPSALSLPRDDFENQYRAVESILQAQRDKVLVVYCAGSDCEDSQMVGDALARLGYAHVRLFRGGWSDWEGGNLPEEKE
jgi:3-mercaptopyruvate sulfurtransferase SseA